MRGRSSSGHCKVEHFAGWLGPAKMRASAPRACVGRETRFGIKYGIKYGVSDSASLLTRVSGLQQQ